MKYCDINLLETDDCEYTGYCSFKKRMNVTSKPKNSSLQEYGKLLKVPEALIRNLLNKDLGQDKKRILAFRKPGYFKRNFREIDFVRRYSDQSLLFMEYKFGPGQGGRRQLNRTIEIAKQKWPKINGFLITTYTKSIFSEKARQGTSENLFNDFSNIAQLLLKNSTESIFSVMIDGYKLLKYAEERGWITEEFIPKLCELKKEIDDPFVNYKNSGSEKFNQPFSALDFRHSPS